MFVCGIPNSSCKKSVALGEAFLFSGLIHFCRLLFPFALLFSILSHPGLFWVGCCLFFKFFFYTWLLFSLSFVLFFPWNLRQFSTLQKIRHSFAVRLLTMIVFVFSLQRGVQQNERLHGLPHEGLLERPTGGRKPSQNDH